MVHLEDLELALADTYPKVPIINVAVMRTLVRAIPAELYLGLILAAYPARAAAVQAVRGYHSQGYPTVHAMAE
jgi:hypothetical protein